MRILLFLLPVGLALTCSAPKKISVYDLSYIYVYDGKFTEMKSVVYHVSDTVSHLFVEIRLPDMDYRKLIGGNNFQADYSLSYRLMESYESKVIVDSATYTYVDSTNFGKDAIIIHVIKIPVSYPESYVLELDLLDINRGESIRDFIWIDKSARDVRQNFLILDRNNRPSFKNQVSRGEKFRIEVNDQSLSKLYVRSYFRQFPYARPPFTQSKIDAFDYKADSVFAVQVYNGETDWVSLDREGFYHFQKDTNNREGVTISRFYNEFPDLVTSEDLMSPLRYITTRNEFDDLKEADNKKDALDQFWLKTAGSAMRAKSLIQKYYNNVQDANYYYTSYLEGWKSDRGLIYIVFGRPNIVYRGYDQEEWIYGEPDHRNSLRFTFVKVHHPFTDHDYMLFRSATFKDPWYITVQSWRR